MMEAHRLDEYSYNLDATKSSALTGVPSMTWDAPDQLLPSAG